MKKTKIKSDIGVLARFIEIYCANKHNDSKKSAIEACGKLQEYFEDISCEYCGECSKLLLHAATKRMLCPYDPKPACKKCPTHCYEKAYREKIREVMKFSGMFLMKHGKLNLAIKYFF